MGHGAVVLKLSSPADAHVSLATIPGLFKLSAYDIAIGSAGNTKTSITRKARPDGTVVVNADNVLDPDTMRWISLGLQSGLTWF